jgi:catechol 2,3-dioxygenase-like lactoylglutathione lyase family enzyme
MEFLALRPVIWTEQLDKTLKFYTEILGFRCDERNNDWGWASLHRDTTGIMLSKPNAHTAFTAPVFTGSFYFTVNEIWPLWEQVQNKVRVCYAPERFDWGMYEFGIYDNNGYLLQFGQEIAEIH